MKPTKIARKRIAPEKPAKSSAPKSPHLIEAIQRGLGILALFRAERPALSLIEISRLVAAVPSTTLRIVNTLEDLGFLELIVGQGAYRAGPAGLRLGHGFIAGSRLRALAAPVLARLRDNAGEAASLGVICDESVYFLDHARTGEPMSLSIPVGARLPALSTAAGKAILAHGPSSAVKAAVNSKRTEWPATRSQTSAEELGKDLANIRRIGYAVQDEEFAAGIRSIAAPILDAQHNAIGAIAIGVGSGRYEMADLARKISPLVVGAAAEVGARWRAEQASVDRSDAALESPIDISDDAPVAIEEERRSKYHVEALARGLQTLLAFTPALPRMTLTEIAARTQSHMSTSFRVVATFSTLGYLRTDELTGKYELSPKVLTLGYDGLAWLNLGELCLPRLLRLEAETGESIYLSVLAGNSAVDIVSLRRPGMMSTIGRSYPLYCTPGGKIMLASMPKAQSDQILDSIELVKHAPKTLTDRAALDAELEAIRQRGYSVGDEELLPGSCGVAVPVRDSSGACVASLAVVVRGTGSPNAKVLEKLVAQARAAGEDLSGRLTMRFS